MLIILQDSSCSYVFYSYICMYLNSFPLGALVISQASALPKTTRLVYALCVLPSKRMNASRIFDFVLYPSLRQPAAHDAEIRIICVFSLCSRREPADKF